MGKQLLNIIGVSTSNSQHNTYALILGVKDTNMRIPIIIGPFEAQAIAIALEGMKPSRPLSHDLMKNLLTPFNINVVEVNISKFEEGVFYSLIKLFDGTKTIEVDSRTSDAIALGVRFGCNIYADDEVIKQTAMEEEVATEEDLEEEMTGNSVMTIEELEDYLQQLIEEENYEEASRVRDEIKRLKEEGY